MASNKEMLRVNLEARWQILIIAKEVLKFAHYFDTPKNHDEHNCINPHRRIISYISFADLTYTLTCILDV